jgi:multidrug efflux system membrane fusion protein
MRLTADLIKAHSLTPALLALADDGTVGVKAVDAFDSVRFYPVEIIDSSLDGMLVTGVPDSLRVISVGQGFVTEGQAVVPVEDGAALSQSEDERAY